MKIYGICWVFRGSRCDQIHKNNNRCHDKIQVEMLIGSEWRSVYADVRYMLIYAWLAYSLFLAFLVTCEQSIVGKACYLSSWLMWYGMMKETLLLLQSTWEILLPKFKSNSLSPRWCWISYQGHMLFLKTFHISCLFCVEFCQDSLTLVERLIMLTRSRSHTCYICVLLLH